MSLLQGITTIEPVDAAARDFRRILGKLGGTTRLYIHLEFLNPRAIGGNEDANEFAERDRGVWRRDSPPNQSFRYTLNVPKYELIQLFVSILCFRLFMGVSENSKIYDG